jgi:hypothetical protein
MAFVRDANQVVWYFEPNDNTLKEFPEYNDAVQIIESCEGTYTLHKDGTFRNTPNVIKIIDCHGIFYLDIEGSLWILYGGVTGVLFSNVKNFWVNRMYLLIEDSDGVYKLYEQRCCSFALQSTIKPEKDFDYFYIENDTIKFIPKLYDQQVNNYGNGTVIGIDKEGKLKSGGLVIDSVKYLRDITEGFMVFLEDGSACIFDDRMIAYGIPINPCFPLDFAFAPNTKSARK